MATYLLKKSYQLKDLKQIEFEDLWGDHGIFTTMWIFGKPAKILFFDNHLKNLILSLKKYQIKKKSLNFFVTKPKYLLLFFIQYFYFYKFFIFLDLFKQTSHLF